jgi:hypothetical protein
MTDKLPAIPAERTPPTREQHKKGTTTVIPQMINEALDSIRYGYATGWANLHAVAERVGVLAYEGRLTDADRDRIHDHLRQVWRGLYHLYQESCDQLAIEGGIHSDEQDRIYSDGSPVYSGVRPAEHFPSPIGPVYCGDVGPVDELELGAEVIVALPPHLRV